MAMPPQFNVPVPGFSPFLMSAPAAPRLSVGQIPEQPGVGGYPTSLTPSSQGSRYVPSQRVITQQPHVGTTGEYRPPSVPLQVAPRSFDTRVKPQSMRMPTAPVISVPMVRPKAEPKGDENKAAFRALAAVKSIFGALVVGGLSALMFGTRASVLIPIDMAVGLLESIGAKKTMDAKNPVTRKLLEFSNRLRGDDKKADQLTEHEKEHALVPLSMIITAVSSLLMAWLAEDRLHKRFPTKLNLLNPVKPVEKFAAGLISAKGKVFGSTKSRGVWGLRTVNKAFKMMSEFTVKLGERKLPVGKYGVVLAGGLFMGWLEGVMAKKLAQHPAAEP